MGSNKNTCDYQLLTSHSQKARHSSYAAIASCANLVYDLRCADPSFSYLYRVLFISLDEEEAHTAGPEGPVLQDRVQIHRRPVSDMVGDY
jgi:hypothetical protein